MPVADGTAYPEIKKAIVFLETIALAFRKGF